MQKALVTGGTGFVGKVLCSSLSSANLLTRKPEHTPTELSHVACFRWDPASGSPPFEALDGCDVVFNLAGEPVAEGRWTAAKKERILDSRVIGTRNLVRGLRSMERPPRVLVSASAVGYYGDRGEDDLTEQSVASEGFLADVCLEWECEARKAQEFGVRVVTIRIGLVLGKGGGALARMLPLFKLGLGGRLGSGNQWVPWIHVEDLARLFVFAANTATLSGPVNGVSPNPISNREFTSALGSAVKRPTLFPAPAFALRLGLGGFAEVLLASQRVHPAVALDTGFEFKYPTISSALADLVG